MDKGIIKMVMIVMIIAITLLVGSICIAMRYGGFMMQSVSTSSDQSSQDSGTGTSNSANSTNQKSTSPQK